MIRSGLKCEKTRLIFNVAEKANCTEVTHLFFAQVGLLNKAKQYSNWVHDFRWKVYVSKHRAKIMDLHQKSTYFKVKFVRCPYDRAVSCYLMFERAFEAKDRSFLAFLEHLQATYATLARDNSKADPHITAQTFPEEDTPRVHWDAIIHVEDLYAELESIQDRLPRSLPESKRLIAEHVDSLKESHWVKNSHSLASGVDLSTTPFSQLDIRNMNYADMYHDPRVRELVERLYALDFKLHPEYTFEAFMKRNNSKA